MKNHDPAGFIWRVLVIAMTCCCAWGSVNIFVSMTTLPYGKTVAWIGLAVGILGTAYLWYRSDGYV